MTSLASGALLIGGSALWRPEGTADAFTALTLTPMPVFFMLTIALVGATGCLLVVYLVATRTGDTARLISLLIACALFDPVLAAGTVLLLAHALPEQTRQIAQYGAGAVWRDVRWPTLVALAGAVLAAALVGADILSLNIAGALAIGFAIPHMLTERLSKPAAPRSLSA